MDIKIQDILADQLKEGVKPGQEFDFGKEFSNRMFQMKYKGGAWTEAEIKKYENFSLSPATTSLHYGQLIFEGLKAYRRNDGKIGFFRAKDNLVRMNNSAERMCMPTFDVDQTYEAMRQLVGLEKDWVPQEKGESLYIRPTMIGTDPLIKLKASDEYLFYIICSPVGMYYKNGMTPTKIVVEEEYVRAVRGGVGYAKTAANYAASLLPAKNAVAKGYDQVLWLDGVEQKYVEEVGTSNIFFKYKDKLVTPELNGSILPGITRDSVIQIAKSWDVEVVEEKVDIREIVLDIKTSSIEEVFCSGTAAVISPLGMLSYKDNEFSINEQKIGAFTQKMYDEILSIQYGLTEDEFGWISTIDQ